MKFDREHELPSSLWILGDGELLERVFVNLIDNAIKYSPMGSQVTFRLRPVAKVVDVEVCDQGFGIPAEDLGRVFDPYFHATLTPPIESSGVGLSLRFVRTAVELHGGSVLVESEVGRGSTFIVRLPTEAPQPESPRAADQGLADYQTVDRSDSGSVPNL